MAALRHGVKTVIIPAANEKDLAEIDQTVRNSLQFITARHVDSVLAAALAPAEKPAVSVDAQPQLPAMPVPQTKSRRKPGLRQ